MEVVLGSTIDLDGQHGPGRVVQSDQPAQLSFVLGDARRVDDDGPAAEPAHGAAVVGDEAALLGEVVSDHRSIQDWSHLVEATGLLVEAVREVGSPEPTDRWHRIPLFLHLRLRKP